MRAFHQNFKTLSGRGKLSEKEVKEAMREVKLALLEADVNFTVVKKFINSVTERAVGAEVLESLTPGQQVIKIVNDELVKLMGGSNAKLEFGSKNPSVILLAGLQGAGKTTMAGKLGAYCQKHFGKSPLLVACDVYRPAAIKQLQVVGEKLNLPVFEKGTQDPVITAQEAVEYAKRNMRDMVIVDTAGRLHIDSDMMAEIEKVRDAVNPAEILLVIDAMTGQDAVNAAKAFNDALELTGVIITKLDGDTRGGAALSVREVTGKPIKFCGNGEKLTDIEPFYPDRMASRCYDPHRKGPGELRCEKGGGACQKDKDKRVHAGRFHAADGADAEHGYGKHAIHGSGHGRGQAGQRTDRRKAA